MDRSSITVNITETGVEFDILEGKPDGIADARRIERVSFDPNKQTFPTKRESLYCYESTLIYWIPQRNQWIGFDYGAYMERSVGPREEDIEGPYLILSELPPGAEEIAQAIAKGGLVEKTIRR